MAIMTGKNKIEMFIPIFWIISIYSPIDMMKMVIRIVFTKYASSSISMPDYFFSFFCNLSFYVLFSIINHYFWKHIILIIVRTTYWKLRQKSKPSIRSLSCGNHVFSVAIEYRFQECLYTFFRLALPCTLPPIQRLVALANRSPLGGSNYNFSQKVNPLSYLFLLLLVIPNKYSPLEC